MSLQVTTNKHSYLSKGNLICEFCVFFDGVVVEKACLFVVFVRGVQYFPFEVTGGRGGGGVGRRGGGLLPDPSAHMKEMPPT